MPCRLLSGPAAALAQASLLAVVLATLLWKRAREHPRRPLDVWGADVAKQVLGSGAAHAAGMAVALLAAAAQAQQQAPPSASAPASAPGGAASECGWYAVAFAVDTALGTWLSVLLHRAAVRAAAERAAREVAAAAAAAGGVPVPAQPPRAPSPPPSFMAAVARCGDYGTPPSAALFVPQAAEWVGCVLAARAACGALVALFHAPLSVAAACVDALFAAAGPNVELGVVMVTGPVALNAAQALVQDAVLSRRRRRVGFSNPPASPRVASAALAGGGGEGTAVGVPVVSPRGSTDMEALLTPLPPDRATTAMRAG